MGALSTESLVATSHPELLELVSSLVVQKPEFVGAF